MQKESEKECEKEERGERVIGRDRVVSVLLEIRGVRINFKSKLGVWLVLVCYEMIASITRPLISLEPQLPASAEQRTIS